MNFIKWVIGIVIIFFAICFFIAITGLEENSVMNAIELIGGAVLVYALVTSKPQKMRK